PPASRPVDQRQDKLPDIAALAHLDAVELAASPPLLLRERSQLLFQHLADLAAVGVVRNGKARREGFDLPDHVEDDLAVHALMRLDAGGEALPGPAYIRRQLALHPRQAVGDGQARTGARQPAGIVRLAAIVAAPQQLEIRIGNDALAAELRPV